MNHLRRIFAAAVTLAGAVLAFAATTRRFRHAGAAALVAATVAVLLDHARAARKIHAPTA